MPAKKSLKAKKTNKTTVRVERPGPKTSPIKDQSFFERIQGDLEKNNSFINIVLGTLIVIVLGVLLFNYFNKPSSDLGPSQQAENTPQASQTADVAKENLPGKYTVKEGDTLFTIAQKYYDDGYKYDQIMQANQLADGNVISVGQVLDIPKLENGQIAQASTQPAPTPAELAQASTAPADNSTNNYDQSNQQNTNPQNLGTGGATNQTIWGKTITGDTYTVQEGDWLSKISGRAYGDIYQYQKLAQANGITNPDSIEVGTVLKIPR